MKLIYFIFLFLILLIKKSNSQFLSLVQKDYDCMLSIANKVSKLTQIPYSENFYPTTTLYNFCNISTTSGGSVTEKIGCTQNGPTNYYISSIKFYNSNGALSLLNYTDFSCFTNLDSLDITYFSLLQGKFFSLDINNKGIARSITLSSCFNIEYPTYYNSPTKIVIYNLANTPSTTTQIKASSLHNLTTLNLVASLTTQPTLPELVNDEDDGKININLKFFKFITRAVPNLTNFNLTSLDLTLSTTSLNFSNFNTFKNINDLMITSISDAIDFPSILMVDNNIQIFTYKGKLNQPSGYVDITPSKNLKDFFYLKDSSSLPFVYPISIKGFPFILPQSISKFYYPNVGSSQPPNFNTNLNLQSISFYANSISNPLPEKSSLSTLTFLDVSENQITGTLPSSYCNTLVKINSNTQLSGALPQCFACYYIYQKSLIPMFAGTNLTMPTSTSTCNLRVVPNFSFDILSGKYRLWGDNIGYEVPTTYPPLNATAIFEVPNNLITGVLNDYYKGGSTYSMIPVLILNFMNVNYSVATTPYIPQISNITIPNLTSFEYTFHGSYFTYNTTNITITIDDYNCLVFDATFSKISCFLASGSGTPIQINSNGRTFYRVDIKIGNFPLQVSVDPNKLVNPINWCSVKCYHGFCVTSGDTPIGFCSCDIGYMGNDCNTTSIQCLNNCSSSSHGICNFGNGICTCNQGFQGNDCSQMLCSATCLNGGTCNLTNGRCSCSTGFEGSDCSGKSCPSKCLNGGTCNLVLGSCSCLSNWQSSDCSIPYKACNGSCNEVASSLNSCDNIIGQCKCNPDMFTGPNCLTPSQYVSSIDPSTTAGGTVNMYGWFGAVNTGLSVSIGSLNCELLYHDSKFLNCTAQPGSGTKTVTVFQNGITWIGVDKYHYTDISYSCPNDCSSYGTCNTKVGQCRCIQGWGGFDCSSVVTNSLTPTTTSTTASTSTTSTSSTPSPTPEPIFMPVTETFINTTTAKAILNNQKTSFEIMITSLIEIDFNGNMVIENKLQQNWESTNGDSDGNKFIFSQTLKNNSNCLITYTIEELKQSRDYTFADLDLTLDAGSIKISVTISNYTYLNSLNTLQLQMESKVGDKPNDQDNKCNEEKINIDQSKLDKNQLLNYLTISKDSKKLYSRFINRVVSDQKTTFITTSIVSNDSSSIVIGLNLPHCTSECSIDPDFSVLVQPTYKECVNGELVDTNSGRASWVLPVAIVVPCVFVVSIIIIGAAVYSRWRTSILLAKERYSFKLGNLTKKDKDGLYIPNK